MSTSVLLSNLSQGFWRAATRVEGWTPQTGSEVTVLFDPRSGETHFLAPLPALLLTCTDDTWVTAQQLVERFAGKLVLGSKTQIQVYAALDSLERAELVQFKNYE